MVHASLFSGIGGPEVAAAMMGWENAFHCEINPFGKEILDYWFPNSISYEDVTKTSFKEWRGRVDVLTGGFPCQPFSYAGKRGGRDDNRYLWPQMLRVIDEIRPTWVVGENVAGITTMVEGGLLADLGCDSSLFQEGDDLHRYEYEEPYTVERICGDLERIGYSVQALLVPAAAVNAPHRRDRIFFIAFNADADSRDDLRGTGKDAFTGKDERIRKRDKVRESGIPNKIRPAVPGITPNTTGIIGNGDEQRNGFQPRTGQVSEPGNGDREDDVPNTSRQGLEGKNQSGNGEKGERMRVRRNTPGYGWETDPGLLPENRWAEFPLVSPIHRGNDGIPFPLDDLSISQTKWRNESLKAYGNAIVPQVMYRIFQAIESATKQTK